MSDVTISIVSLSRGFKWIEYLDEGGGGICLREDDPLAFPSSGFDLPPLKENEIYVSTTLHNLPSLPKLVLIQCE